MKRKFDGSNKGSNKHDSKNTNAAGGETVKKFRSAGAGAGAGAGGSNKGEKKSFNGGSGGKFQAKGAVGGGHKSDGPKGKKTIFTRKERKEMRKERRSQKKHAGPCGVGAARLADAGEMVLHRSNMAACRASPFRVKYKQHKIHSPAPPCSHFRLLPRSLPPVPSPALPSAPLPFGPLRSRAQTLASR